MIVNRRKQDHEKKLSDDQIAEVRAKAAGVKQNEATISIELPTQVSAGNSARIPESKRLIDIKHRHEKKRGRGITRVERDTF